MRRTAALAGLILALAACAASEDASEPGGRSPGFDAGANPRDAGTFTSFDAGTGSTVIPLRRVVEEFDNRLLVDSSSVALIDVNAGVVTLPAQSFPRFDEHGLRTVEEAMSFNGLYEGGSVIITADGSIEASDALELRARDVVRVTGRVRAGAGGVTIAAGSEIHVDGVIETSGPVRLRLAQDNGRIDIAGRIRTLPGETDSSPSIGIYARGSVRVLGQLETEDVEIGASGAIEIVAYGEIELPSPTSLLSTGDCRSGEAGSIRVSSESEVRIGDRATVQAGSSLMSLGQRVTLKGGGVSIRAEEIRLGTGAAIGSGGAPGGAAGSVELVAAGALVTGSLSVLQAGDGATGGTVDVEARTATIARGTKVAAGAGRDTAGRVVLKAAGDVHLGATAQITGGDGRCANGGDVVLLLGGELLVDPTVLLKAGAGGTATGTGDCIGAYAGGNVQIVAQETPPGLETTAMPGTGAQPGKVHVLADPNYTRPQPDIRARTVGWVLSRTFDRGDDAKHLMPRLVTSRVETPRASFAKIQLAGAETPDGPFDRWSDLDVPPGVGSPLIGARYLRYRVWLKGRALDAPVVDSFEIDLAP